jgi:hypothetical protein
MATASDMAKNIAVQSAHLPSPSTDPNIEIVLQGLMIDDTDLKRILKGEIQEPLNKLREIVENLNQIVIECFKTQSVEPEQGKEILGAVQGIKPLMEKIEVRLTRYYKMVPYLLVLSPLTRLSNLTVPMVESLKRKVGIMIGRDKLMASGGDESFENANFWDALEMSCCIAIQDSLGGWKMQGVVTEKRQVSTIIEDRSKPAKKHWWQP